MSEKPLFAVSEGTTYHAPFINELAEYPKADVHGIGLWEFKLEGDRDAERSAALADAGLSATFCFPLTPGIFTGNGHFAHPKDAAARLQMLKESVKRFSVFNPVAVCILAGAPQGGDSTDSRRRVVAAFKEVIDVAKDAGVKLALEVISPGSAGSLVQTIPQAADLIADAGGEGTIGVLLDNWHIADEPLENIREYIDVIAGIQVCDRAPGNPGRFDRALPGQGVLPVEGVIRTAHDAGYRGWYELEIFSDDGTFGEPLPDPMWQWPTARLLDEGKAAFDSVYAAATAPRATVAD
ncbi:sugar phosphate isomerase/epimerase family protein [Gryllotalpicola reticulitermitis]|uniref:Sugar phosphate isomerase/epimerase family protein n=1 Tax=Gryllotalpicola reticulitermitis TaxID=1184153 RepID=A0ABV8Q414_9MICO